MLAADAMRAPTVAARARELGGVSFSFSFSPGSAAAAAASLGSVASHSASATADLGVFSTISATSSMVAIDASGSEEVASSSRSKARVSAAASPAPAPAEIAAASACPRSRGSARLSFRADSETRVKTWPPIDALAAETARSASAAAAATPESSSPTASTRLVKHPAESSGAAATCCAARPSCVHASWRTRGESACMPARAYGIADASIAFPGPVWNILSRNEHRSPSRLLPSSASPIAANTSGRGCIWKI